MSPALPVLYSDQQPLHMSIQTAVGLTTRHRAIKYEGNGSRASRWGFEIQENEIKHERFTVDLDLESALERPSAHPPVSREKLESFMQDYLAKLQAHTDKILKETLPGFVYTGSTRHYVITVPSPMTERAKESRLLRARRAGMNNVSLTEKPEAIATFALDRMSKLGLKVADSFIICDAGEE